MTITITKAKLAVAVLAVVLLVPATAYATHVFGDVPDDKFYAGPVEWASDNGITTGTGPTTFEPDRGVTRGESVTFLKRYHDNIVEPGIDAAQTAADAAQTAADAAQADADAAQAAADAAQVDADTNASAIAALEANTLSAAVDGSGNLVFGSGVDSITVSGTSFTRVKFVRAIDDCVSVAQIGTTSGSETTTGHIDISYEASDTIGLDIEDNTGTNVQKPFHLVVHC